MVGPFGDSDQFEGGERLAFTFLASEAGEEQRKFYVFQRGEYGDEIKGLKDESDILISPIGQLGFVEIGDIDPLDAAGTAGGGVDPCDNVEQGGFS